MVTQQQWEQEFMKTEELSGIVYVQPAMWSVLLGVHLFRVSGGNFRYCWDTVTVWVPLKHNWTLIPHWDPKISLPCNRCFINIGWINKWVGALYVSGIVLCARIMSVFKIQSLLKDGYSLFWRQQGLVYLESLPSGKRWLKFWCGKMVSEFLNQELCRSLCFQRRSV